MPSTVFVGGPIVEMGVNDVVSSTREQLGVFDVFSSAEAMKKMQDQHDAEMLRSQQRIDALEARLEQQDRAIAELRNFFAVPQAASAVSAGFAPSAAASAPVAADQQ